MSDEVFLGLGIDLGRSDTDLIADFEVVIYGLLMRLKITFIFLTS